MLSPCETDGRKYIRLAFLINVDWYFLLHWKDRALAAKKNGYDVYVFTSITSVKAKEQIEHLGFSVVAIPISRQSINPFSEILSVFRVASVLQRHSIDVVHAITIKPVVYASIARYFKSYPMIMSFPGLGTLISGKGTLKRLFWLVTKLCLGTSASDGNVYAIFENKDDKISLENIGISFKHSYVIPGAGVDTRCFRPVKCFTSSILRVLFAARLLRNKGLFDLVRAVEVLRRGGCGIELHVAGIIDQVHSEAIVPSEIEELSRQPGIIWHGHVEDMVRLINGVDVICLPTTYGEGIPRALIEGAACGKPLVSTDMPGCREIVIDGYNGFLIAPGSHLDLVSALRRLAEQPELRSVFGNRGRALVEHGFSNDVVIGRTLEVYSNILPSGNRGPVRKVNY